jgi:hypothetical protein
MPKRKNPMFKKTTPVEPEILTPEPEPFNETFPGGATLHPPLSVREQKLLVDLEAKVTAGIHAFIESGRALREIQEKQLYRGTHNRFDLYVKEKWDMDRSHAYHLIDAVKVLDNIQKALPEIESDVSNWRQNENVDNCRHDLTNQNVEQTLLLPQNESQARALAKYPPDKQIKIWKQALLTMKNGRMTASHIRATADAMSRQKVKRKTNTTRKNITQTPRVSDGFRAAFQAFLDQINVERADGWKNTDASEIARHLRGLLQAVEAPL